jgi:hypothetical protein
MVCKPTCTYLITQNEVSRKNNIYKHMQDIKPNTCKGRVTFNVDTLNTYYRKEEHWIYDRNKVI